MRQSLQDQFAAKSICFGCGPANEKGLQIKSFVEGDKVVAHWHPQPHHEAFPGILNGGIIGALLDCHSNWTAAWHIMQAQSLERTPCTVTAEYSVKLLRPTPSNSEIKLVATLASIERNKAVIEAQLMAGGKVCDTCIGTFVAVKPDHPAYHRW